MITTLDLCSELYDNGLEDLNEIIEPNQWGIVKVFVYYPCNGRPQVTLYTNETSFNFGSIKSQKTRRQIMEFLLTCKVR